MTMSMSKIKACEVTDCAYNKNKACHALAITVGDASHPRCDTFTKSASKGGDLASTGSVGACKIDSCKFNRSLECSAKDIMVGLHQGHADCKTFSAR